MSAVTKWLDSKLYPGCNGNWGDEKFRIYILKKLETRDLILDLGAGVGIVEAMNFKGLVRLVAGVDPDPAARQNRFLDEFKILSLPNGEIPYAGNSFDLVFANNVLEHVENPNRFFAEIHRVLKPGGLFLAKTPNKRHYVAIIARITPHGFHEYINKKRGRRVQDTFRTVYKSNTPGEVARYAAEAGFEVADVQMWEGRPEYLRLWSVTYLLGHLYQILVNKISSLSRFRCVMVCTLQKPGLMACRTDDLDPSVLLTKRASPFNP
jgi:SAM-dependent methyltransferase